MFFESPTFTLAHKEPSEDEKLAALEKAVTDAHLLTREQYFQTQYQIAQIADKEREQNKTNRNKKSGMLLAATIPQDIWLEQQMIRPGCWADKDFVKTFLKFHPEFKTANI